MKIGLVVENPGTAFIISYGYLIFYKALHKHAKICLSTRHNTAFDTLETLRLSS